MNETKIQKQEPCRCYDSNAKTIWFMKIPVCSAGWTLNIRRIFIIGWLTQMRLFPLVKEGLLSLQKKTSVEAVEHLKLMRSSGLAELHVWGEAPRQDHEHWGSQNPGSLWPVCFIAREAVSFSVTHNHPLLSPTPFSIPTMEKEMKPTTRHWLHVTQQSWAEEHNRLKGYNERMSWWLDLRFAGIDLIMHFISISLPQLVQLRRSPVCSISLHGCIWGVSQTPTWCQFHI